MDIKKANYVIKRLKEFQLCCNEQGTLNDTKTVIENTNIILDILIREIKLMDIKNA